MPTAPVDGPTGPTPIEPWDWPLPLEPMPLGPGWTEPGFDPVNPGFEEGPLVDPRALWLGGHGELAAELPEFLAVPELDLVRGFALEHERDFEPSVIMREGASMVDPDSRNSVVMDARGTVERLIRDRVAEALPYVLARLGLNQTRPARIDVQLTATNDGGFFRAHCDASSEVNRTRRLSYVYFFNSDPAPFAGGELKLWATEHYTATPPDARRQVVAPQQNTIVFFRGSLLHEVTPVQCPSGAFADSRFTANGWIHW